jgi:DNA-binding transcriptional ArsR family regulator
VSDIAGATKQRIGVASQYLRDLQSRGLIGVRRRSRWTFYDPVADPSVGHAAVLLAAAQRAISEEKQSFSATTSAFAAFAHPRRLQIVRFLHMCRAAGLTAIGRNTGISERALLRHLQVLVEARVVIAETRKWRLALPATPLLTMLVRESCR